MNSVFKCATFKVVPVFHDPDEPYGYLCVARHRPDACMIGVGANAPDARADCLSLLEQEGFGASVELDECTDEQERRSLIHSATLNWRQIVKCPIRAIDDLRALALAFGNGHDVWN